MITLSGKEKKALRAQGQTLATCANVGKGGLTPGVLENINGFLSRAPLIKIRLPAIEPSERKALATALAEQTNSALVAQIGHAVLLYRPTAEAPELAP